MTVADGKATFAGEVAETLLTSYRKAPKNWLQKAGLTSGVDRAAMVEMGRMSKFSKINGTISSFADYHRSFKFFIVNDLPLNFHPAAIRASAVFDTPDGAVGATGGNA